MLRLFKNRRVWIAVAVVGGLLAIALWPTTMPVEVAAVSSGPLVVTVDEEGQTRVRQRYVVSAPVTGRVMRIELEPGDMVKEGDVVGRLRAETPPLLDARTRAEIQAAIASAKAALGRAQAEEQRTKAALAQAERELKRAQDLVRGGVVPPNEVDLRQDDVQVAAETSAAAAYNVKAAQSELERTEVRLHPSAPDVSGRVVEITAPTSGVVLKRLRESESMVPAGDPLLEIGNPGDLEIVSDLLSTDAVQVKPGARAMIEQWGGSTVLDAKVRRIEPSGFTKISALGVEEQRVNVILDFADPAGAWTALGDGYRVEVRIVIWEAPKVVKVPTSALFRQDEQWAVYVVEEGVTRLTIVELGQQTGQEAEVQSGLTEGALVVLHPADTLTDGARVEPRPL